MKRINSIPFNITSGEQAFVSKLTSKDPVLTPFLTDFGSLGAIRKQVDLKKTSFESTNRMALIEGLKKQGANEVVLNRLANENAFTITTGHQLNLLTGPLYSIYKIASVISIAEKARKEFPEFDFIPVFWMATEDHDFEEINHINLFGEKISWETDQDGPVGRFEIKEMDSFKEVIKSKFREIPSLLEELLDCYKEGDTLNNCHKRLVELLFKNHELLIIDGDSKDLKQLFVPKMKKELTGSSFNSISSTNESLEENSLKVQAHVRDINLFYVKGNYRNRITKSESGYQTADEEFSWSLTEIESEMDQFPQYFSPNVLFRPMYQETILPNLVYVGGGGELAYWCQLKDSFKEFDLPMPLIQLRYSALLIKEKQWKKWESFGFNANDLFSSSDELDKQFVANNSDEVNLASELEQFHQLMNGVLAKSNEVNDQLDRAVESEKVRILKQLEGLEKRIQKNQKATFDVQLGQINKLKNQLFPNNSWQERIENVVPYLLSNENFVDEIIEEIVPFNDEFQLMTI
jgi:bacillithiol biosynthesis cysteine-adding enzyme BshC